MFNSIFGKLFDFNRNGKIDTFERITEFAFLDELIKNEKKKKIVKSNNKSNRK